MKHNILLTTCAAILVTACASTNVQTNKTVAAAMPEQSAAQFLNETESKYPITTPLGGEFYRCSFGNGHVIVSKEKVFGTDWKEIYRMPYKDAVYFELNPVPFLGRTVKVVHKDRMWPDNSVYGKKWCMTFAGKEIKDGSIDEVANKVATALEALGINKKP